MLASAAVRGIKLCPVPCQCCKAHPVLSKTVQNIRWQVRPKFLIASIAVVLQVIAKRPSLLGLEVEKNIKPIVSWLQDNEYSRQEIAHYLGTSI